jgi:pimeloyl-ACP methyl ester carboxylesterase
MPSILPISLLICALFLSASPATAAPLLPILCVHGWQGYATDFARMIKEVNNNFPGRHIASVSLFDGKLSEELPLFEQVCAVHASLRCLFSFLHSDLDSLSIQARRVREFIESDAQLRGGQPFILIGHSQGTLVSRALLEEWDNHPVQMFVSLAGPHLGQYGLFADLLSNPFLRGLATSAAWTVLYTKVKQARLIHAKHTLSF